MTSCIDKFEYPNCKGVEILRVLTWDVKNPDKKRSIRFAYLINRDSITYNFEEVKLVHKYPGQKVEFGHRISFSELDKGDDPLGRKTVFCTWENRKGVAEEIISFLELNGKCQCVIPKAEDFVVCEYPDRLDSCREHRLNSLRGI